MLPDEARGDDDAAAVAFVEHWVELVNYAIATGDTEPARSVSADCSACAAALVPIDEGRTEQYAWQASNLETVPPLPQDASTTDQVVIADVTSGAEVAEFAFGLVKSEDTWRVLWLDGQQ